MTKTCRRCATEKALDAFHKQKRGKYGHDSICKECSKLKTYEWRAANPGGHAKIARAYRKRNPEVVKQALAKWLDKHPTYERDRARRRQKSSELPKLKAARARWEKRHPAYRRVKGALRASLGAISVELLNRLLSEPCVYCGAPGGTIDHVVPVTRGGTNSPENLVSACRSCNSSKKDRLPLEWFFDRPAPRREGYSGWL